MSVPPERPQRLAEILGEILALSNSAGTNHCESAWGSDPIELIDAHCVNRAKNEEHALDIELEK
jgi:predicted secreted protein